VRPGLRRAACWLAGAWAGLIAGIGFVAAPALFATLPRGEAGRVAARLFSIDATLGVCVGAVLLLLCLQLALFRSVTDQAVLVFLDLPTVLGSVAAAYLTRRLPPVT